jgi:polysaccharide chain length determinant protein (PEP-CTERM system associated)
MVPGRRYNARYVVRALRRSWWMLVAPLAIAGTLAIVIARALPDVYYAQGVVRVVPPRVSEAFVKGAAAMSLTERVATARAQVLTTDRLKALIAEYDLYPAIRDRVPEDVLLSWMRSSVRINLVSGEIFTVGFYGYNKQRVERVSTRLTTDMVDATERLRATLTDSQGQFLETELEGARKRLEEHEQKVSDYRRRYAGQLPTQVEANLRMLQSTSAELQTTEEALNRDRTRRDELTRELDAATAAQAPAGGDAADPDIPDPPAGDPTATIPPGPPSQQLRAARIVRARLARRLTAEHPDMQALDRSIAQYERAAAAAAADAGAPSGEGTSRVAQLRGAIKTLDTQIATREATSKRLRDTVAAYRTRVDLVPEREAEWVRLTRDYNTLQGIYSGLLAKREESRIAANVDRQAVGEQVNIIDAPKRPTAPVSPNRRAIALIGVGIGVGLGVGMLLLRELTDRTIRAEEEVLAALNLPVVGLVPKIVTVPERRQLRRRRLLWSFAALVLCVGLAALRWNG